MSRSIIRNREKEGGIDEKDINDDDKDKNWKIIDPGKEMVATVVNTIRFLYKLWKKLTSSRAQ